MDIPWEHLSLIYGGEGGDVNGLPPDRSASPPHVKDRFPARAAFFLDARNHSLREQSPMIEEILKGDLSYWDPQGDGEGAVMMGEGPLLGATHDSLSPDGGSTFGDTADPGAALTDSAVTGVTRHTAFTQDVTTTPGPRPGPGQGDGDGDASGQVGSAANRDAPSATLGAPLAAVPPGAGAPGAGVPGARQPLRPSHRPVSNPAATSLRSVGACAPCHLISHSLSPWRQ